jgi:Helix-turn-helix of DDE superfamily endonuclease
MVIVNRLMAMGVVECRDWTEPQVDDKSTKTLSTAPGVPVTWHGSAFSCTPDPPRLLTAHRKAIGCRWRRLSPGRQALLVLAHLRNGDTYSRLAAGFGIGVATVFRYIGEAVDLLATRAPTLTAALRQLTWSDRPLAILDGTLIPTDRLGGDNNRLYYSGCATNTASTCKRSLRATCCGSQTGCPVRYTI